MATCIKTRIKAYPKVGMWWFQYTDDNGVWQSGAAKFSLIEAEAEREQFLFYYTPTFLQEQEHSVDKI